MKRSLLFLSSLLATSQVHAAACCGGGFAAPSVITSDDRAQISSAVSYSEVVVDNVDAGGVWRKWDEHQRSRVLRMEGAHLLSDRTQAGISIPVVQRTFGGRDFGGLGDVGGTLAYEFLPDWDYHAFRPRGHGYLRLTLPTGKSRAESEIGGLDSRGNGFWSIGVGTILTKKLRRWDAFSNVELRRSFEKSISTSQMIGTLKPGYGGNLGFGGGYNTASWRLGTAITWSYEDPVDILGTVNVDGAIERYATASASISYMLDDEWAGSLNYSDQTLFGSPANTSLARSIEFAFQRRWLR